MRKTTPLKHLEKQILPLLESYIGHLRLGKINPDAICLMAAAVQLRALFKAARVGRRKFDYARQTDKLRKRK